MQFSIVIPCYNEQDNIVILLDEIYNNLKNYNFSYEVIIVDDASNDKSVSIINDYKKKNKFDINLILNKINIGQSFSIINGVKASKHSTIVTIDGDGQNNPSDILELIDLFKKSNLSLLGGIRYKRKDSYLKKISSIIANNIRKKILNDDCDDTGCSLKVFNKEIFLQFPEFDGLHRFLPAFFKGYGYKTDFVEVNHRQRIFGKSKYGTFLRLFKGIIDLTKVYFIIKKVKKNKQNK